MFADYQLLRIQPTKADLIMSLVHYEVKTFTRVSILVNTLVYLHFILTECDASLSDLLWNHIRDGSEILRRADGHYRK